MNLDIKTEIPRFIVLPSIVVSCTNESDYKNIANLVLEPIYGQYNVKFNAWLNNSVHEIYYRSIILNNIIYHITTQYIPELTYPLGFRIYSINSNKFVEFEFPPESSDGEVIGWPHYENEGKLIVLNDKLELVKYDVTLPKKYLISDKRIKLCLEDPLVEIDEYSYLDKSFKRHYHHEKSKIPEIFYHPKLHIYNLFEISRKYVCFGDGYDNYLCILDLHTKMISTLKTWFHHFQQICEDLIADMGFKTIDIHLLDENAKINNSVKTLDNIGFCLLKMKFDDGIAKRVTRVIENPFKTAERDRLANWLYESLEKILPLTITGLITEYCTLVRYYDYDVLMNHIKENQSA